MDNRVDIWILMLVQLMKGCISQLVVEVGGGVVYTVGAPSTITVRYTPGRDFMNIEWFYNSEALENLMGRVFVDKIATPSTDVVTDPAYGGRASFGFTTTARPVERSMTLSISAMLPEDDGKVILIKAFETSPKSVTVPLNVSVFSIATISTSGVTAVGSMLTISTRITSGIPISADYTMNWKAGTAVVASHSLTASGAGTPSYPPSDFQGRINVISTAATNLSMRVENLLLSDNGTVFSIAALFGSVEAGSSTASSVLQVAECPAFSDASPSGETCSPYHFDCTSTFKCNTSDDTFTATCLSDATFDNPSICTRCPVNVTCRNCENLHATDFPLTIKEGENVTVRCLDGAGNVTESQVSVCSDGNAVNVNITCDATSRGALISFAVGTTFSVVFLAAASAMLSRKVEPEPEPSDNTGRKTKTSDSSPRSPEPVGEKPSDNKEQRYFRILWVFILWIISIVLVIVGVGLLAGQYAKCVSPDPAACALVDLAVPGLVLVVLAIMIDLGLIIWVVKLTCCPTAPSEKNGGNSTGA